MMCVKHSRESELSAKYSCPFPVFLKSHNICFQVVVVVVVVSSIISTTITYFHTDTVNVQLYNRVGAMCHESIINRLHLNALLHQMHAKHKTVINEKRSLCDRGLHAHNSTRETEHAVRSMCGCFTWY